LPWYLDEFKDIELSQNKSNKDPTTLNLILKQARRRLNIKIQEII